MIVLISTSILVYAQYDEEATRKEREYMIMDGSNLNFAWARQLSENELSIGLSIDNGILRWIDNEVWMVGNPGMEDQIVAHFTESEEGDTLLFYNGAKQDMNDMTKIFGGFNLTTHTILDKDMNFLANIDGDGNITGYNNNILLIGGKVDLQKIVFFFLYTYIPEKEQL